MQLLSENHLNGRHIFGRFGFFKLNPNRISVFYTSLADYQQFHSKLYEQLVLTLNQSRHVTSRHVINRQTNTVTSRHVTWSIDRPTPSRHVTSRDQSTADNVDNVSFTQSGWTSWRVCGHTGQTTHVLSVRLDVVSQDWTLGWSAAADDEDDGGAMVGLTAFTR